MVASRRYTDAKRAQCVASLTKKLSGKIQGAQMNSPILGTFHSQFKILYLEERLFYCRSLSEFLIIYVTSFTFNRFSNGEKEILSFQ